jgi:hypothetical protein
MTSRIAKRQTRHNKRLQRINESTKRWEARTKKFEHMGTAFTQFLDVLEKFRGKKVADKGHGRAVRRVSKMRIGIITSILVLTISFSGTIHLRVSPSAEMVGCSQPDHPRSEGLSYATNPAQSATPRNTQASVDAGSRKSNALINSQRRLLRGRNGCRNSVIIEVLSCPYDSHAHKHQSCKFTKPYYMRRGLRCRGGVTGGECFVEDRASSVAEC